MNPVVLLGISGRRLCAIEFHTMYSRNIHQIRKRAMNGAHDVDHPFGGSFWLTEAEHCHAV